MERIRQAVELAKGARSAGAHPELPRLPLQPRPFETTPNPVGAGDVNKIKEVVLDLAHLEANRIIAHDRSDLRSRSFDMLRTQVLQSMDLKSWQLLAVTSPTPNCGKSLTAINLALSIARQPERSVLLVDMDIEKPRVANYLGLQCKDGLLSVLEGRVALQNALVQASVGSSRLTVLSCEASTAHSSEYMTSRAMATLLQEIKSEDRSRIIIFDMPPMLSGDTLISILPQIDCVLFVAAVGTTTASEIKECNKHLQTSAVIRVVLNKASELGPMYY
jgi:Mrp family chromosome partitioning ATPase